MTSPASRAWRTTRAICISGVFGILTSIAIAWAPPAKHLVKPTGGSADLLRLGVDFIEPKWTLMYVEWIESGSVIQSWDLVPLKTAADVKRNRESVAAKRKAAPGTLQREPSEELRPQEIPRLPSGIAGVTLPPEQAFSCMVIEQGWPMRCLTGWSPRFEGKAPESRTGLLGSGTWGEPVFAYIPLWPGLFANTAIYGGAWFLLGRALLAARRRRRRRKGRCTSCGYDLAGVTSGLCPECGAVRAGQ